MNRNTKDRSEIYSKLTIKTPENVKLTIKVNNIGHFIVNFEIYLSGPIFGILIDSHVWGRIFGWGEYIQGAYQWDLTDA